MSVVVITDAPRGVNLDMYDAVNAKLGTDNGPPEGMILHTAGMTPDGIMRVVDVWESQEAHDQFVEQRLAPAIAEVAREHGMEGDREADRVIYEAHDVVMPGAAAKA